MNSRNSPQNAAAVLVAAANQLERQALGMAAIVHNVPNGVDWGFYSNEEPRMHLQVVRPRRADLKAWLEEEGKRVFKPVGEWPASYRRALSAYLADEGRRGALEREWIGRMMEKDWMRLAYEPPFAVVTAYPGMPHEFTRRIDVRPEIVSVPVFEALHFGNMKLDSETACLVLRTDRPPARQIHVRLDRFIFVP